MTTSPHIWPGLVYADAPAALTFLRDAFGFVITADYRREGDDTIVDHAELRWPLGGGIMLGSADKDDRPFSRRPLGGASTYVVCDDPDALFARAALHAAPVVMPLTDQPYGSREFTVRDPEGNLWTFGTYAGAPLPD